MCVYMQLSMKRDCWLSISSPIRPSPFSKKHTNRIACPHSFNFTLYSSYLNLVGEI